MAERPGFFKMATKTEAPQPFLIQKKHFIAAFSLLMLIGIGSFGLLLAMHQPERAWQAVLINFLIWSAIAQGGLLFSVVMHLTKARWSRGICGISESFAAFFPVSIMFYAVLFFGRDHIFPWLHHSLEGKEAWLNLPFLFSRDIASLCLLYGLGLGYVYFAMKLRFHQPAENRNKPGAGKLRTFLNRRWQRSPADAFRWKKNKTLLGVLYAIAFAFVLSLISYDLVMSANPHFISTLFGAYSFVKAFYVGLGGLIILLSVLYVGTGGQFNVTADQFHDLGKLFFGFCLLWADFFYCQLVVIWYGNIPEEAHYVITRTMISPWRELAWFVFAICFILPFFVLLNKAVKTKPGIMTILCTVVIMGIWLEHILLLGPELNPGIRSLPIGFMDGLVFLGFFGIMAICLVFFFDVFPELIQTKDQEEAE